MHKILQLIFLCFRLSQESYHFIVRLVASKFFLYYSSQRYIFGNDAIPNYCKWSRAHITVDIRIHCNYWSLRHAPKIGKCIFCEDFLWICVFSFYTANKYHRNVCCFVIRWECDDIAGNNSYTTLHQVWAKVDPDNTVANIRMHVSSNCGIDLLKPRNAPIATGSYVYWRSNFAIFLVVWTRFVNKERCCCHVM